MRRTPEAKIVRAVQACLTDKLRLPKYRGHKHPLRGHCSVASEATYHLLGGKKAGWTPSSVRVSKTEVHWFLRRGNKIVDPTAGQFTCAPEYGKGRGRGFPTPKQGRATPPPSKRAKQVIACARRRLSR